MADARSAVTLDLQGLQGLLDVLRHMGFTVLRTHGPQRRRRARAPVLDRRPAADKGLRDGPRLPRCSRVGIRRHPARTRLAPAVLLRRGWARPGGRIRRSGAGRGGHEGASGHRPACLRFGEPLLPQPRAVPGRRSPAVRDHAVVIIGAVRGLSNKEEREAAEGGALPMSSDPAWDGH
jgi:hypothetical protein